jgi:hypothetical protein
LTKEKAEVSYMKIRPEVIAAIIQNAVFRGVTHGLEASVQEAQKPENANNHQLIADVVSWFVMQNLNEVLDLKLESLRNEQSETEIPKEERSSD